MKNTKTISKLAMFVATLAAGATIASIHVAAHADTLWAQGTTQSDIDAVNAHESVSDNQLKWMLSMKKKKKNPMQKAR
ncbi:hypothetical protein AKUH4B501J_UNKNOWN200030 (plasmid) [Apilactobacillus kunkeei]|nr:hypothetical protein AKUH4B501J_UNKNOWN200030 [Apilactobacillus kunkeei]